MNITKAPCLAFITGGMRENIGKIVQVTERFGDEKFLGKRVRCTDPVLWLVRSEGSNLTMATSMGNIVNLQERPVADSHLREIKGDDESMQTDTPQQLKEPA